MSTTPKGVLQAFLKEEAQKEELYFQAAQAQAKWFLNFFEELLLKNIGLYFLFIYSYFLCHKFSYVQY